MAESGKQEHGSGQPKELKKHDASVLDLAFAMDCTGSMGSYIRTARENIRKIAEEITASEKSDIRFALVEYRDHPPEEDTFVTRVTEFTPSLTKMKAALDKCSAEGGGDFPEAVADALHALTKLNWRKNATKIVVFVADAPPHGLVPGDNFANGCPDGLDPLVITRQLAQMGVTIYMVGCEPSIAQYKEFMMTLSYITGGQYVPLQAAKLLTQIIIGGAQEEMSLEKFMAEVQEQVGSDGEEDEDEVATRVFESMKSRGIKSKHVKVNKETLPEATDNAKKWSSYTGLSDVRKEFKDIIGNESFSEEDDDDMDWDEGDKCAEELHKDKSAHRRFPKLADIFFSRSKKKTRAVEKECSMGGSIARPRSLDPPPTVINDACDLNVEEEEISMAQVKRMVKKGKARSAVK